jgi:GNAT superfamily N-acetyltransferase
LQAFIKGNLYGLCMPETQEMYENVTPEDPRFMLSCFTGRTHYRFPVFCAVDNNRIDLLWVAARMRRRGLGTRLVSLLKEQGVSGADYVEGALPFWQRFGTVTHSTSHAQVHF